MKYVIKLDFSIRIMPGFHEAVSKALQDAGCFMKVTEGFREIFYCNKKPVVSPIYCVEFEEIN